MKLAFDYKCKQCEKEFYLIVDKEKKDSQICPACGGELERLVTGFHMDKETIPIYPGSHARMAGYCHQYVNRPAEKISVSVPKKIG